MPKRSKNDSDSDSSYDDVPPRKCAPSRLTPQPLYCAIVKEIADDEDVLSGAPANGVDDNIISRIRKCLDRAYHPEAQESEAKAALHFAHRLMKQYNISKAEAYAAESAEARQEHSGESIVTIQRSDKDKGKAVLHQAYLDNLLSAMRKFFDCKCYTTKYTWFLEVHFYGIRHNTTAAAYSCEMVYNQVNDWAQSHKGGNPRNSYLLGVTSRLLSMAKDEMDAEERQARNAEAEALRIREQQENREREEQLNRLAPLPSAILPTHTTVEDALDPEIKQESQDSGSFSGSHGTIMASDSNSADGTGFNDDHSSWRGFSSDEDDIEPDFIVEEEDQRDPSADFDSELQRFVKSEPETDTDRSLRSMPGDILKTSTDEETASTPATHINGEQNVNECREWASHMQLILFRSTASKLADDYLSSTGLKMKRAKAKTHTIRDRQAYDRGRKDSKKIDVRRRRIVKKEAD